VELTFYYALMLWRAFLKARRERREREEKVRVAYRPGPAKRGQYPESRGTVAPNPGIVRARSKVGSASNRSADPSGGAELFVAAGPRKERRALTDGPRRNGNGQVVQ
jgi:hypothetical protein